MTGRRTLVVAAVSACLAAGGLPAEQAAADPVFGGRVWVSGTTVRFVAYAGAVNRVVTDWGGGLNDRRFNDDLPVEAGPGCWTSQEDAVCPAGPAITAVFVDLGDQDDVIDVKEPMGTTVFGGDGDDQLYGDFKDDRLYGGPGDDTIIGGPGADGLFGGDGYDTVRYDVEQSPPGELDVVATDVEWIIGGTGRYHLHGTAAGIAGVDGGELSFTAAAGHTNGLAVSRSPFEGSFVLDDEQPVVAAAGCGHPVRTDRTRVRCSGTGVTWIVTWLGDLDDAVTNDTSTPSTLVGGAGADQLTGGGGMDVLNGGAGVDLCTGGERYYACERHS